MGQEIELKNITQNLSILYVEDDHSTRKEFEKIFKLFFKEVLTAENGQIALEMYQNQHIDLLVTDLTMPIMDGVTLIREVLTQNSSQHIIIITAHNTGEDLKDSIEHQIDGILMKPVDIDHLLHLFLKVCRSIELEHKESYISSQCKSYNLLSSFENEKHIISIAVIDKFDEIVKQFGYETKDYFRKAVEKHLSNLILNEENFLWHNDVFIFIVGREETGTILIDLQGWLEKHKSIVVQVNDLEFKITISYGMVDFDTKHFNIQEEQDYLFFHINAIVSEIRKSGRNSFIVNMDINSCELLKKEAIKHLDITLNALKDGSVIPFYQPIVDSNTLQIISYEVFARIEKNGQLILPKSFIDLSEKAGLLQAISENIFEKSYERMSKTTYPFHINVTNAVYFDSKLEEYLTKLNIHFNIPCERIILDITNYSLMKPNGNRLNHLVRLKEIGYKIALKGFGKETIRIDVLSLLQPDFIKFDQDMIQAACSHSYLKDVITFILKYAKHANIKTILVGVEDERSLQTGRELGFDYLQGYFIGTPKEDIETRC